MATQPRIDNNYEVEPLLSPTSPTSNEKKVWYKTASAYWLLPTFVLISITNGLGITTKLQFYLRAVCYDYYSSKGQPTFSLNPTNDYSDEYCNNAEVQAITSRFLMIMNLCSAIPAIFVLGPLGSLSDIKGRKINLLIATIGSTLTTLNILLVGTYLDTLGLYFLLIGSLIEGITGGFLSIVAASYAYATDCTPPAQRSVIFGWLQGALFIGLLGPMIGGWIVEITNNLLSVFYVMTIIYIITFLFFLYILPESLTKEKLLENLNRRRESNLTLNTLKSWLYYSVFNPLTIFFKNNNNNNDNFFSKYLLLLLASINTLLFAAMMGIQAIFLLYVTLVFKWSLVDQGYYLFIVGLSRVFVLLVLFPILNDDNEQIFVDDDVNINDDEKQMRKFEVWVLRIALLIDAIAYAGYGLATSGSMFIGATVIASLGSVSSSVLKSLQTNLVDPSQIGQLLGALSVLESITRIIAPIIFNALYSILVITSPNLIWYSIASILVIACLISFVVVH
ncbi:major facilitator superfamily domain-containing protein [Glomus cerebriforme]|uniref:Major facilitator superfamily domain-containing protein n=1 Tax=Glomus cerebriforme TaxID=658196 RepID=A0A397T2D7_9GLOM|nr:major facilitator superfamily domain-containing protein [Glomus cerebriforme]